MYSLPNTDRGPSDEEVTRALQLWLWVQVGSGWRPFAGIDAAVWSAEDSEQSMGLGWMIAQPPECPWVDLYSLSRSVPAWKVMEQIRESASIIPLCAKALAVLTAQKLKHPNVRFNYEQVPSRG